MIGIRKTKLGADHPATLTGMANLAFTWKVEGQSTEATDPGQALMVMIMVSRFGFPRFFTPTITKMDIGKSFLLDEPLTCYRDLKISMADEHGQLSRRKRFTKRHAVRKQMIMA